MPPKTPTRTRPRLTFAVALNGTEQKLALHEGEVLYIGRASRSAVHVDDVSVSSQQVLLKTDASLQKLLAQDCSRNGTGLRDVDGQIRRLSSDSLEELQEGMDLVIPLKRKGEDETVQDNRKYYKVKLDAFRGDKRTVRRQEEVAPTPGLDESRKARMLSNPDLLEKGLPDMYDPDNKTGRWRYDQQLGEGGLGVVYRAFDCVGTHGDVAIKVLKPRSKNHQKDARFAFEMHRESQWSLWHLHNEFDEHHHRTTSELFARYVEDNTGFSHFGPQGFHNKRRTYEAPDFDWDKDGPQIPQQPYVVMEFVMGEALHLTLDRQFYKKPDSSGEKPPPVLSASQKREVLLQAARALAYLSPFGLIHRDFRGCNMHLISRGGEDGTGLQLKVLDLGVMIAAEDGQASNSNQAVQAFKRRGETEEKRRRYDWLPWEVRAACDEDGPAVNFAFPTHAFDVFSMGVLILHMLIGRTKTRSFLESLRNNPGARVDTSPIGLDFDLLRRMLGAPEARPHPKEILESVSATPWPPPTLAQKLHGPQDGGGMPASTKPGARRGSRSRSRSRENKKLTPSNEQTLKVPLVTAPAISAAKTSERPVANTGKYWLLECTADLGDS